MRNASPSHASARPAWFRIVAIVFLLWNLIGVYMCWSQSTMTPGQIASLTPGQQQLWNTMPAWMWVVYAVAVVSGALGALMLVLNKRVALPLFIVSLLAVLVQFAQAFLPGGALDVLGAAMALPMPAFIAAVAVLQVWVTRKAIARGWIG
jgi:VanZ family protein